MLASLFSLLPVLATVPLGQAANADQWRSRSIYQLLTDRFAPATENAPCSVTDAKYCGGNWQSIIGKLDYIAGMGYDAVYISPTAQNIEGLTPYGEAFHGFWATDHTKLNPHFGTSDDLKALSKAVHDRGMFLMVDLAINHLASLSSDISNESLAAQPELLFKHTENFHPMCKITYGNPSSEQNCWMATSGVFLMDLDQNNEEIRNTLLDWVPGYVQEYGIDGFRLDATKHMTKAWQHDFCAAAGVFCMGEAAGDDTKYAASYQGEGGIDSVFGFGMKTGFVKSFTGSNPSMNTLASFVDQAKSYPDESLIGAFLDNQDLPRFNSLQSDKTIVYNAIVGTFLRAGIPAIYYGLEQDLKDGTEDPKNREPLWQYGNYATDGPTYQRIKTLNGIRKALGGDAEWLKASGRTVAVQQNDIALKRKDTLIVLTNRGEGASGSWKVDEAGFEANAEVIDLLSCEKAKADGSGALTVAWSSGQPFVYVPVGTASAAGLCGATSDNIHICLAI